MCWYFLNFNTDEVDGLSEDELAVAIEETITDG